MHKILEFFSIYNEERRWQRQLPNTNANNKYDDSIKKKQQLNSNKIIKNNIKFLTIFVFLLIYM